MKELYRAARLLAWVTQFGFSVAAPLAGCILLAVWLQGRFALGGWVVALGVVLGLMGALGGLVSSVRRMDRQGAEEQKRSRSADRGVSFNEH
ncbi:MAG TPA: AtpZ/AtpI family protein [Candidatus Gemmiger faecigallinarum]|nr:AtpZ/AtpI family protein [Candidatus Gemmiger faecigallinarum]